MNKNTFIKNMQEIKYNLEITYQPINKCWGVNIKKGNLVSNLVGEDLKSVMDEMAEKILLTQNILSNLNE